MGLETATFIGNLNAANPAPTDLKSQGDDHLRMIKQVLQNTFAGFAGMVIVTGTESMYVGDTHYKVTVTPAPTDYTSGMLVVFKATHTNSSSGVTIQVNSLSQKSFLSVTGGPLSAQDITNGSTVIAFYDGTNFYLLSGNDRSNKHGDTYSGTHNFSGATLNAGSINATTITTTGIINAHGGLDSNGQKVTSVADAVALTDAVNLRTAQAIYSGGGTPSNIPITSLGVGTAISTQRIRVSDDGLSIIGDDDPIGAILYLAENFSAI